MLAMKRWAAAAAAGGVLLLGGLAAATPQEAGGPVLNADSLAAAMELDDEGRAELRELAGIMERRMEVRRQMARMHGEMSDVMRSLRDRLTPEQATELHRAMRQAMHRNAATRGDTGSGPGMMHRGGDHHRGGAGSHMGSGRQGGMMTPGSGAMGGGMGRMQGGCPFLDDGSAPSEAPGS